MPGWVHFVNPAPMRGRIRVLPREIWPIGQRNVDALLVKIQTNVQSAKFLPLEVTEIVVNCPVTRAHGGLALRGVR